MKILSIITLAIILVFTTNSGCKKESIPTASFTFTGGNCKAPCQVRFTNTSNHGTGYVWDFGDGSGSEEVSPWHTYDAGGNYNVTLTAIYSLGSVATVHTVSIAN